MARRTRPGRDTTKLGLRALRSIVGLVPQDIVAVVFFGTGVVRDGIGKSSNQLGYLYPFVQLPCNDSLNYLKPDHFFGTFDAWILCILSRTKGFFHHNHGIPVSYCIMFLEIEQPKSSPVVNHHTNSDMKVRHRPIIGSNTSNAPNKYIDIN